MKQETNKRYDIDEIMSHDIFISYSRDDDRKFELVEGPNSLGWVTKVRSTLEHKLTTRRKSKIWMDKDIGHNEQFPDEIAKAIEKIPVFLIVLSPNYLDSFWCAEERDKFIDRLPEHGPKNIFIIQKYVLTEEEIARKPSQIRTYIPLEFFKLEGKGLKILGENEINSEFLGLVDFLATEIGAQLPKKSPHVGKDTDIGTDIPTVMLGDVKGHLLENKYRELFVFLNKSNIKVLPQGGIDLMGFRQKSQEEITELARDSDLFVQLVSKDYIPEAHDPNDPDLPALEIVKSRCKILTWSSVDASSIGSIDRLRDQLGCIYDDSFPNFKKKVLKQARRNHEIVPERSNFVFFDRGDADKISFKGLEANLQEHKLRIRTAAETVEQDWIRASLKCETCKAIVTLYSGTEFSRLRTRISKWIDKYSSNDGWPQREKIILTLTLNYDRTELEKLGIPDGWKLAENIDSVLDELDFLGIEACLSNSGKL